MSETVLRVLDIIRGTTVDGPGFRTSIYIAGCRHACPGCQNPQSWDFNAGKEMTVSEIIEIVKEEDFNVTLTGGDPLYHPKEVAELTQKISAEGYKVWIYTGFRWEEIAENPLFNKLLQYTEVMVDGQFLEDLKDPDLLFRGSTNQRLIDVANSLKQQQLVLYR